MSDLVSPNGRPLASSVTVTQGQVLAVAKVLLDAQVAALLNQGAPPLEVIALLGHLTSNLLSRFDPPDVRSEITRTVLRNLERDTIAKARRFSIRAAVGKPGETP